MPPPRRIAVTMAGCALVAVLVGGSTLAPPALEPASTGGLELVDRALAKLSTHRRVLLVGAHPDDEDNSLLTWVSRGLGGEAAYLSLSRGEGGQNLIGPELGVELGAIRTGELMAARRVEGTRQYFARAFDFGYTRSLDETFERWPREVLQRDAVRAARRFKPQLVVSIFPESERAGHGHHQASAVIARDLFEMAGNASAFPELAEEGLVPWQPSTLFRRTWFWRGESSPTRFELSTIDPLTGKSLGQGAAESRSLHRSQDMGRTQPLGPLEGGMHWLAGGEGAEATDPFAGVDMRLAAIAATVADPSARSEVAAALVRVEELARTARRSLSPILVEVAVGPLTEILDLLARAHSLAGEGSAAADLIREKVEVAELALAAAAGVAIEATADRETAAPGGSFAVTVEVWPTSDIPVEVTGVELLLGFGGEAAPFADAEVDAEELLPKWRFEVPVPADAAPTLPYFLAQPRRGDLYDWPAMGSRALGEPLQPPPVRARVLLEIAGRPIRLEREVVYRYGDQAVGEVRRPLRVLPALEVEIEPGLVVRSLDERGPLAVEVTIRSNVDRPIAGSLELTVDGVEEGSAGEFAIEDPRGGGTFEVELPVGAELEPRLYKVNWTARLGSGAAYSTSYPVMEHPHVRPISVVRESSLDLRILDLAIPPLRRIGYVRGASDRVPEMLANLGLPVELLAPDDLAAADLAGYDAIVVGSRAYETEPALGAANGRLLDYASGGGLVLVQYQQYQFARGGFAPYPLQISRPHGRVTDETSPVRLLDPGHPVFRHPNLLGEDDWQGWVQERGLYFAGEWDERYTPLLELADPGRTPERGSLLVAEVGEGRWVYTGLSFFRELPAGVPGAIRLFANLLALGERP